ncbi:MAG: hypothetical protein GWP03_07015, partial [Proteobacteria bacterium]|nr:hypothetical protein [Pseudomonadota bacterium]
MTLTTFYIIFALFLLLVILLYINYILNKNKRNRKNRIEENITEINQLIAGEKYKDAEIRLNDLIEKDTDNISYFLMLADIYRATKRYEKTFDIHTFLSKRASLSNIQLIDINIEVIRDHLFLDSYEEALDVITELRSKFKISRGQEKIIKGMELTCYESLKNYDKALKIAKKALSKYEFADYLAFIASKMISEGNEKEGEKLINKAYGINKNSDFASMYKAEILLRKGKLDEAAELLGSVLNHNKNLSYTIAKLLRDEYKSPEQLDQFENVILQISKYTKNNYIILQEVEDIYLKKGNYDKTLSIINEILQADPDNLKSHVDLAYIYTVTNQDSKLLDAISDLNR